MKKGKMASKLRIYTVTCPDGSAWGFLTEKEARAKAVDVATKGIGGGGVAKSASVISAFTILKAGVGDRFVDLCIPKAEIDKDPILGKLYDKPYTWASLLPA